MVADDSISAELSGYENSLAKQFHAMEKLEGICRKERELILNGSNDSLMKNTEDKEAALDKFSLLEENSRMFLQTIALKLKIQSDRTNIRDVLPFLDNEDSFRIKRLLDGINALAQSAKEVNMGNQALVMTRMDWVKATQSFINSLLQPEEAYQMPIGGNPRRDSMVSRMEYRI